MFKKVMVASVALALALTTFVSCSSATGKPVVKIDDVSVDSVDIAVSDTSKLFSAADSHISEALFKYLYLYYKKDVLDFYSYYESQGYSITGDANIAVGDTEAFWNCTQSTEEDGTVVTFGDTVYETVVNTAKNILALEQLADDYKFVCPDDFEEQLEAAIYNDVKSNGSAYLDDDVEFADENDVVYDWVKARRELYLASKGITAEEWERVFFVYQSVLYSGIKEHLEFAGVIEADSDESIKQEAIEYIEEQYQTYLTENVKIDYLFYQYNVENDESSEDVSDGGSSDASTDASTDTSEEPQAETNEQILKKCKDILAGLSDGSLNIADEIKKAPEAYENKVFTKDVVSDFFGDETKECKAGDIKLFDTEYGVYIVAFKELTETDFGRTTAPTDEELNDFKELSLNRALSKVLEDYINAVKVDEDALIKYQSPWNIK